MKDFIPQKDFDSSFMTIKLIKDRLESGTSIKFERGDFIKKLFLETDLFSSDYFYNTIMNENSMAPFYNLTRHGGLRYMKSKKRNGKEYYIYANADLREQLERKNSAEYGFLYNKFTKFFKLNFLKMIWDSFWEDNATLDNEGERKRKTNSRYYAYINGLVKFFSEYVTKENTYYKELYNEIIELLDNDEIHEVLSLFCLIAIFQDDIHIIFPDKYRTRWSEDGFFPFHPEIKPLPDEVEDEVQCDPIPFTTNELFEAALSGTTELGKIVAVDMCFHGGALWRTDGTKNRLLTKAINTGAKIRVIVNTTDRVQELCSHMKQPDLEYVGFERNLENWVKLMLKYPESVEIHIATVPLLRRSYIIRGEKSKGWANITYYSYGHVVDECQRVNYRSGCQEYKLYFDEFEYIWNNASEVYSEPLLTISKPKRNDGFNESDEDNIAFVRKALESHECQAFDIISVLAYYCAIGRVRELIKSRLSDDSNFVLRMILPDPKNGENLEKWFLGFDKETMTIFKTFESWAKRYPDRFLLHYTDLPIADRMYINKTEKKMLVEHLSIPRSTNQALQEEYNKTTTPQIYDAFEDQFERIWTEFSYSFK